MDLGELIRQQGIRADLLDLGVAMTNVRAAAEQLGCSEAAILKSLVIEGDGPRYLVAVLPGGRRIDWEKLRRATGLERPRLVPAERVREVTGYPAGGVPPLGHPPAVAVWIDASARGLKTGYGGGGVPEALLRIDIDELIRVTQGQVAEISK